MLTKNNLKIESYKRYFIGFIIGISFISGISYASTGTIGGLFEKIGGSWKLDGVNIKNGTIGANQLGTNSVTTTKIVDKNVTEAKLSDAVVTKLNSPIVTEIDPLSVKLTGNQTIGGTKTFTSPVFGVTPTLNAHLVTKQAVDNAIAAALTSMFTCGDTITVGGFTYTTKIAADGKCWTSTNMKHIPTTGNTWCYNNIATNCDTYGRLYDWNAATSNGLCGALGTGWKLPTDAEWTTLTSAGATGWLGNKLSGLINSVPGYRDSSGFFDGLDSYGIWWSSTQYDTNTIFMRLLINEIEDVIYENIDKNQGLSVLCINPTITGIPASINGICGSSNGISTATSPTTNLCSSGVATSVITNTSNYTWSCTGLNGGTTSSCNAPMITYTYSWNTGTWGECSVSCGGGTQTRSVTCRRNDGVTVVDSFCSGAKPVTSQSCNPQSCVLIGGCENPDGIVIGPNGEQYGYKIRNGVKWTCDNMRHIPSVGNSWCYNNDINLCNIEGRLYDWTAANHSSVCNVLGEGWELPNLSQWTDMTSIWDNWSGIISILGGWRHINGSFGENSVLGNRWTSTQYGSNTAYSRHLGATYFPNNNMYSDKNMGFSIVCVKNNITYTYSWNTGTWGSCSVSCGGGTQTRSVTCRRNDGVTVSDSFCSGVKPVTSQVCNTGACVGASLVVNSSNSWIIPGDGSTVYPNIFISSSGLSSCTWCGINVSCNGVSNNIPSSQMNTGTYFSNSCSFVGLGPYGNFIKNGTSYCTRANTMVNWNCNFSGLY